MNRKLIQSVREYKKESILAPILVALEVFMEVLIPLMMAKIIDVGMVQGDMGYIVKVGLMLVVMAMLALFFGAKAGQLAAVAAAGYAKNDRFFLWKYRSFFYVESGHETDDRYHERADGVYVYDSSAGQSANHDCAFSGDDSDDQ